MPGAYCRDLHEHQPPPLVITFLRPQPDTFQQPTMRFEAHQTGTQTQAAYLIRACFPGSPRKLAG
jgi:hypothetical protein